MFSEIPAMIMSKISTPKHGVSTPKHSLTRLDFTLETSAACAADATEGLGGSSSASTGGGLTVNLTTEARPLHVGIHLPRGKFLMPLDTAEADPAMPKSAPAEMVSKILPRHVTMETWHLETDAR